MAGWWTANGSMRLPCATVTSPSRGCRNCRAWRNSRASRCTVTTIGVRTPWRTSGSSCSVRRYRAATFPASWHGSPRCSSRGRLFEQRPPLAEQSGSIRRCPPIAHFDGSDVVLTNGERIREVDAILFCTGYWYRFPFLASKLVSVGDNYVRGLYRQVVALEDPSLAFIGLPFRIVPFPLFQRQARWFARSLAGQFQLPDLADRRRTHCEDIARLGSAGVAERHFHRLEDGQIDYMNGLAEQCGDRGVPDWFVALWLEHKANARRHPKDYRERPLRGRGPTIIA